MIRNKKILTYIAGILSAVVLAGCAAPGTGPGKEASSGMSDETAPKGRYMEAEILFPEETKGMELIASRPNTDGTIEFYFVDDNGRTVYSYDGNEFTKLDTAVTSPDGVNLNSVTTGLGGQTYYGGFDGTYTYHLWSVNEAGAVQEWNPEVFQAKEGEPYGLIPDYIQVLEDGSAILSDYKTAAVYTKDGKQLYSFPQDFTGSGQRYAAFVSGEDYYTTSGGKIVRYNVKSGQPSGEFQIPVIKEADKTSMLLFGDGEGGMYSSSGSGLYHTSKDGTVWEQLIDGALNYMSRPDYYMTQFCENKDGSYLGLYAGANSAAPLLYKYTYDASIDAFPPQTLTVYSLKENASLRQTAALMQKNNPNVRVDLRVALGDGEEASEDVIRALNTELVNKKGADVLILDGLPAESYREKGILEDLTPVLMDIHGELLPGVADSYKKNDKICYLPARIKMPIIFGDERAVEALMSFDKMEAYDGTPSLLTAPDLYENVLRMAARLNYDQLFEADGSVKSDNLRRYLTAVKAAGEKSGVEVEFTEDSKIMNFQMNSKFNSEGIRRLDEFSYAKNECAAGIQVMDSFDSIVFTIPIVKQKGTQIKSVKDIYFPSILTGINSASQNKELAEEFIKILFGKEIQDVSFRDGFPVRTDSLDLWVDMDKDYAVSYSESDGDFTMDGSWPVTEERKQIIDMVKSLSTPVVVDETVMNIIIDNSKNYFSGKESVEGAVKAIENQVGLYTAEKE